MTTCRLFIAISPGPGCLNWLEDLRQSVSVSLPSNTVRWTRRENLHLTLGFLGDTPVESVPEVNLALRAAVEDSPDELHLTVSGPDAFPGARRPRVITAVVSEPTGRLARLQRSVCDRLRSRGFQPDPKPFRPHITLGYVKRKVTAGTITGISSALRVRASPERREFTARKVHVIRSTLAAGGSIYETLYSVSLGLASRATSSGESARE